MRCISANNYTKVKAVAPRKKKQKNIRMRLTGKVRLFSRVNAHFRDAKFQVFPNKPRVIWELIIKVL